MLQTVRIPVQPSCLDCLAWSSEGELAVAAGEEVHLLIPRHGCPEPWTDLRITISKFTIEEWPQQEQASFEDMSIGEEQARPTVTALAWSPPGLAKHRRCVLAVLTSNLILSLWAPHADPTDPSSWERVLLINKVLPSGSRLQQRIRSMAWAPTNPQHVDRRTPFSQRKWGIPIMGIADDNNGLYILKISSPFAGQSLAWNIEVVKYNTIPVHKSLNRWPSLLSLAMDATHFIDHVEFGTWNGSIPIFYRTSGITHYGSLSVPDELLSRTQPGDASDHKSLIINLDEDHSRYSHLPDRIIITPSLKAQMLAEKRKFGLDNNIGSHVMVRMWGLATFKDMVSACITLHPAKMVEYTALSEGNAFIPFGVGGENDNAEITFPWQNPAPLDVAIAQGVILDAILDEELHRHLSLSDLDLKIMYSAFCGILLLIDDKRLQRLEAAVNILKLLERHASTNLQAEHRALLTIKTTPQLSDLELAHAVRQMIEARGQQESRSQDPKNTLLNLCPFCPNIKSVVLFDNFIEAYCQKGHAFGRPFTHN